MIIRRLMKTRTGDEKTEVLVEVHFDEDTPRVRVCSRRNSWATFDRPWEEVRNEDEA